MAIATAFCTSAKVDLLFARHNFTAASNVFKLALYEVAATLGAATTAYSATNEAAVVTGTGYTAGGAALTSISPSADSTTAITDFADLVFTLTDDGGTASLAAQGCLIYNDAITTPVADAAISTHLFAGTPSASGNGSTFTVTFPAAAAGTAILRLA